ncbi:MAG TPA: LysR family transcriptional regulator [Hyphomonadaceae bacterium]|nr:LysR family transcriptional regulator [Hyphomonadaceae bacterium]
MEMQQVRYFVALARELNFTRAAEACNVSQPALTRAIQGLEAELGGPLFHRERSATHLSELGRMMLPHLEQMMSQVEQAKAQAKKFKKAEDIELKLGAMCTIAPEVLARLLIDFSGQFDNVRLNVKDYDSKILIDGLHKGAIAVAMTTLPDPADERLHGIPLYTEEFVVVLPPNHRLVEKKVLTVKDLDKQPYVNRINCEAFMTVSEHIQGLGVTCPMVFRSERDDWVLGMIRAGMGWGFFPAYARIPDDLPVRRLTEPTFSRTIQLVTVRGRPHSPAVGAFVRAAKGHKWPGPLVN